jgi:two-component system, LytTR family, response regulator
MSLRTMIVDDEPLALELLGHLLAGHEDIEIVAECQNGREAVQYLRTRPVDLLFLDVEMPQIGGFEVIEQIGVQSLPPLVFVTAYAEHAVRAFEIHAMDYLTKPIHAERLNVALQRVRDKIAAQTALLTQHQLAGILSNIKSVTDRAISRILVKVGEKEILLPVEDIDWIEAAEYYCCLHANGHRYMIRESIGDLSGRLDPKLFIRIHRSSIVNLSRIREVYREGSSDASVVLASGQTVKMSKSGKERLNNATRF